MMPKRRRTRMQSICGQSRMNKTVDGVCRPAARIARREGFAERGQRIVITAGIPFGTPGATNVLHVAWIGE